MRRLLEWMTLCSPRSSVYHGAGSAWVSAIPYNGDGQRVQKQDSTGTTNHLWDSEYIVVETNGAGAVQSVYTQAPEIYGDLISMRQNGVVAYAVFDAGSCTRQLINSANSVVESYTFDAFGNLIAGGGAMQNPFTFAGQSGYYLDVDLTSYFVRARYLDPRSARFFSRDPAAHKPPRDLRGPHSSACYQYVSNDPVNAIDPTGMLIDPCPIERRLKQAFYKIVRANFLTDDVWGPLFDDWFKEQGPDPRLFDGLADEHNKQIAKNIGFKKLLQCWFAYLRNGPGAVPAGRWVVDKNGFSWQYTFDPLDAAGSLLAFTDATNFLGSYTAKVTILSDDCPICDIRIEINNKTGWDSATGIPGRMAKYLKRLGINTNAAGRSSVWPSHPRGSRRCPPSTGGNFTQIYTFEMKNVECVGKECRP